MTELGMNVIQNLDPTLRHRASPAQTSVCSRFWSQFLSSSLIEASISQNQSADNTDTSPNPAEPTMSLAEAWGGYMSGGRETDALVGAPTKFVLCSGWFE